MTTYHWGMAVALAPMTVGCPKCLAARGSHCRSAGGYQNSTVGLHAARKAAVAHLSDRQRYDAYAAMKAEEEVLRAQVRARLAEPVTAEVAAVRRRTAEVWKRAVVEAAAEVRAEVRTETARRNPAPPAGNPGGNVVDLMPRLRRRRFGLFPNGVA